MATPSYMLQEAFTPIRSEKALRVLQFANAEGCCFPPYLSKYICKSEDSR